MNMKQSCKALICAIEGELDGRHCTEEQAAAILDHALPSLTEALARVEAERDQLRDNLGRSQKLRDWSEQLAISMRAQLDAAQAQLAEAVGLLTKIDDKVGMRVGAQIALALDTFLARHAQAEQQEAQYISVQEVWEAAGGNPGIKADREQLLFALKTLDQVCDEAQGAQASEFQREDRYIVIKRKDLVALHRDAYGATQVAIEAFYAAILMIEVQLPRRDYLVIESDWPEYEPTWAAIQARVTGQGAQAGDEKQ